MNNSTLALLVAAKYPNCSYELRVRALRPVGLEVGADHYVAKPFHMRELLARIKSVLRLTKA